MKKHFNNNKGSTLVLLVMAIAVISLLGTSILGVTMMNLKIKKTNTEIKQSFYLSESGLDKTYDKTYKFVVDAYMLGNNLAQEFINDVTGEFVYLNNSKPENPASIIGEKYKDCIIIEDYDPLNNTYSVVLKEEEVSKKAEAIYKNEYKNYLSSRIESLNNDDGKLKIIVEYHDWDVADDSKLNISIDSSYTSDKNIKKETSVDLKIGIPDYNEPYTVDTKKIPEKPLWANALIAENIEINGESNTGTDVFDVNVYGDVFVLNDLKLNGKNIKSKFDGDLIVKGGETSNKGIILNGAGSKINVSNVYTKNILMEGPYTTFITEKDKKYNVYVKDDLEMNNAKQKVDINGSYYGFSFGGELISENTVNSAIIVNSDDISKSGGSSINITDELYLFGTSYIKNTPYATGESLSIVGNYSAYSMPLSGDLAKEKGINWDNIDTVHYEPLPPLASKFKAQNMPMQPWNKGDYFKQYIKEYGSYNLTLNGDNIKLGSPEQIKTLGIAINGDNIIPSAFNEDFFEEISDDNKNSKKSIYNLKVNKLGDISNIDLGDLDAYKEDKVAGNEIIYIDNDGIYIIDGKYIDKVGVAHTVKRGLIITNGDINISGKFSFSGAIICGGTITINVSDPDADIETLGIIYDKNIVAKIIEKEELFKNIFKVDDSKNNFVIPTYNPTGNLNNIEFSKYLNFGNWKIE